MNDDELHDLTPEEKRLLRSRWSRDVAESASEMGGALVGCVVSLVVGAGLFTLFVWIALEVLGR